MVSSTTGLSAIIVSISFSFGVVFSSVNASSTLVQPTTKIALILKLNLLFSFSCLTSHAEVFSVDL